MNQLPELTVRCSLLPQVDYLGESWYSEEDLKNAIKGVSVENNQMKVGHAIHGCIEDPNRMQRGPFYVRDSALNLCSRLHARYEALGAFEVKGEAYVGKQLGHPVYISGHADLIAMGDNGQFGIDWKVVSGGLSNDKYLRYHKSVQGFGYMEAFGVESWRFVMLQPTITGDQITALKLIGHTAQYKSLKTKAKVLENAGKIIDFANFHGITNYLHRIK